MAVRVVAAVSCALALTACSSGDAATPTSETSAQRTTAAPADTSAAYVALGDSFTAGPGLPNQQPGSGFCQRSALNWPTLLAAATGTDDVSDLSCSGATTADLLSTVTSPDLGAATRLVTISVGGNDGGLFSSLLGACAGGSEACGSFVRDSAPKILATTQPAIVELVDAVRAKAPDARIVLVGYLRIMPQTGTCESVGIPAAEVASVVSAEEALDAAQASAAQQAGIDYVSLRRASLGHDACAGDAAWTNGGQVTGGDGIVFHPRAAGMRAVAKAVAADLQG